MSIPTLDFKKITDRLIMAKAELQVKETEALKKEITLLETLLSYKCTYSEGIEYNF